MAQLPWKTAQPHPIKPETESLWDLEQGLRQTSVHHVARKHLVAALRMCSDGRLSRGNVMEHYPMCNGTMKCHPAFGSGTRWMKFEDIKQVTKRQRQYNVSFINHLQ